MPLIFFCSNSATISNNHKKKEVGGKKQICLDGEETWGLHHTDLSLPAQKVTSILDSQEIAPAVAPAPPEDICPKSDVWPPALGG